MYFPLKKPSVAQGRDIKMLLMQWKRLPQKELEPERAENSCSST
jgi:hypothetical protein